jgi:uridine kinase
LPRLGLHDLLDLLIEVAVLRKLLLDMSGENCLESLVRNPLVTRIINMSKTFQESPNVGPKSNQFVENPWSKDRVTIFGYSSTIH